MPPETLTRLATQVAVWTFQILNHNFSGHDLPYSPCLGVPRVGVEGPKLFGVKIVSILIAEVHDERIPWVCISTLTTPLSLPLHVRTWHTKCT
jgi:hypothetical protein